MLATPRSLSPLLALAACAPLAMGQELAWEADQDLLRREGGRGTEDLLLDGLGWLAAHQASDGAWRLASFAARCADHGGDVCDGPGGAGHDVGGTGLAVLALATLGGDVEQGPYREEIERAARWLLSMQHESGSIGAPDATFEAIYDHLIATLALASVVGTGDTLELRPALERAVAYTLTAQAPGAGWRYDVPSIGDSDSSVTVWALTALDACGEAGIDVPIEAFATALEWIESMSLLGRVGYDAPYTLSARTAANEAYGREYGEALTAAGLWARHLMGVGDGGAPNDGFVKTILGRVPVWLDDVPANDMYYWLYGTLAIYQTGGKAWKTWNRSFIATARKMQVGKGGASGSWDPVGPWGYVGGRVYATAVQCLGLGVYYRYPRFSEGEPSPWRHRLTAFVGSLPVVEAPSSRFVSSVEARLTSRRSWDDFRYTLDGSEPTLDSPSGPGPIVIDRPVDLRVSAVVDGKLGPSRSRTFTRVEPLEALEIRSRKKGVLVDVFRSKEASLDEIDVGAPLDDLTWRALECPSKLKGEWRALRFTGVLEVDEDEMYRFVVDCEGPVRLVVSDQLVLERTEWRVGPVEAVEGGVPLAKGWHRFRLEWFNPKTDDLEVRAGPLGGDLRELKSGALGHL